MVVLAFWGLFSIVLVPGLLLVLIINAIKASVEKKELVAEVKKLSQELKEAKRDSRGNRGSDLPKELQEDMTPPAAKPKDEVVSSKQQQEDMTPPVVGEITAAS